MFCEIPEFGRCCFCLPLRQGILIFGYINIIFSGFMVGVYSFSIHRGLQLTLVYHGGFSNFEDTICVVIYCADIIFNFVLVYGAHKRNLMCLNAFFYYVLSSTSAVVLMGVLGAISSFQEYGTGLYLEFIPMFMVGLGLNLYLFFLVKSLLQKLERSGQTFENQLHQFVNGEIKAESNGVYPPTVVPNETV